MSLRKTLSLQDMENGIRTHDGGNRFKNPPSPKGTSKIHQDLAISRHQAGGQPISNGNSMLRKIMTIGRKIHIGIVGGGVSGLRCAEVLLQHGVKVTVIEARDRLGGRLGQGSLKGGQIVDLGPNWIHGTENNPMMDLANQTGTVVTGWGEKQVYIDSDKSIVPLDQTREAAKFGWTVVAEAFKESNARFDSIDKSEQIPTSKSLADFFEEKLDVLDRSSTDEQRAAKITLFRKAYNFWGPFVGLPVERQSLKFFWLEECLEGENLFCADSYFKILQKLSAPVRRGAQIIYNRTVRQIFARNDKLGGRFSPALVHSPGASELRGKETAEVPRGQEAEDEFDEVVVTTPLGWLKQHPKAFEPPLPERISSAIQDLGYGTLDKVYVTFPSAWWNQGLEASKTPSDNTSDRLLAEDTDYAGFTMFLQPEYAKDTNPTLQNQEICNLAALPGDTAQPTLLFYIYADFARQIGRVVSYLPERAAHEPAGAKYIDALWPYFEPYVSQLPHYDAGSIECRPADVLATAWVNDALAGNGSYTNFPTGLERGDEDVEALREGLPDSGIWFAGEHTAPFVALGTVTGAYWSGEAVARRILGAYGIRDAAA